jgi:hypothetical protein
MDKNAINQQNSQAQGSETRLDHRTSKKRSNKNRIELNDHPNGKITQNNMLRH